MTEKEIISAYMRKLGKKGGKQTLKRHGSKHFERIASKELSTDKPLAK